MDVLRNPKILFFSRVGQLVVAIAYLILVAWCGTHRGYWNTNVTSAIALGVIATIFTLVVTAHGIWSHIRTNPFASHGKVYTIARIVLELLIILLWIGTASLMLRDKGEDYSLWLDLPPFAQWDVCIAFSFIEIVLFIVTAVLVFVQDLTGRSSGGTTNASYV
ncbi:hypothetical protein MMC30_004038 [Trapelia coarctata]|nr:hypothetical protein [Trapelia coarctata]